MAARKEMHFMWSSLAALLHMVMFFCVVRVVQGLRIRSAETAGVLAVGYGIASCLVTFLFSPRLIVGLAALWTPIVPTADLLTRLSAPMIFFTLHFLSATAVLGIGSQMTVDLRPPCERTLQV